MIFGPPYIYLYTSWNWLNSNFKRIHKTDKISVTVYFREPLYTFVHVITRVKIYACVHPCRQRSIDAHVIVDTPLTLGALHFPSHLSVLFCLSFSFSFSFFFFLTEIFFLPWFLWFAPVSDSPVVQAKNEDSLYRQTIERKRYANEKRKKEMQICMYGREKKRELTAEPVNPRCRRI